MTTPVNQPGTTEQPAAAPAVGTPEYNAAMTARAAQAGIGEPPAKPTKPEGLPDKFWDADKGEVRVSDLAKSYSELEKKQGQPAAAAPNAQQPAADTAAAAAAVTQAGFDMATLEKEFAEQGSITPETRAKLAEKGITSTMVDSYIAGRQALATQYDNTAFETAGGEEQWNAMTKWAATGLKPSEVKAFNDAVTSGDVERMKLAVAGVRARYESANGVAPKLLQGDTSIPAADAIGFASHEEMKAAMRDPRYKKDEAYRKQVEQRVGRSAFAKVQVLR